MGIIRNIIDDNRFAPEDMPAFKAKLFFEGEKRRADLERFVVLLFLSTLIAAVAIGVVSWLGDRFALFGGAPMTT